MNQEFQQQLIGELVTYFQSGEGFANKTELQKFASRFYGKPILPGMVETKIIEECAEKALVQVSGTLLDQSETTHEAFDKLVDLYERQPNLSTRTSDSVKRQAYSTPLPIAFIASSLANIQPGKSVYEPTAGNGALLLNADKSRVYANEIYDDRIAQLKAQGFGTITQVDGTTHKPPEQVDVVVLNPPYGTVKEEGKTKTWIVSGGQATRSYRTSQIDQVIAFKALEAMKDEGRAVLILPAPMEQKTGNQEGASNSYNSSQNVPFWLSLYRNYNVTEHFTVHGDLYAGQGTAYPVDVVVIEGRGRSARMLPAADLPAVYRSFDQLKELLPNETLLRNREGISSTNRRDNHPAIDGGISAKSAEPSQEPGGLDGSAVRPSGVDDPQVGGGRGANGSDSISSDLPDRRPGRTDPTRIARGGRFNPGLGSRTDGRQPGSTGDGQVSQPDRPTTGNPISRFPNRTPDRSTRPDRANSGNDSTRVAGTNDRHMQGRDAQLDSTQQQPQQAATTEGKTMADQEQVQQDSQEVSQVPYVPRSKARPAGTLLPVNMNTAVQKSLRDLEARVGSIDAFMESMVKVSEMPVQPFAEQLDSIALAIDNLERGEAFILGDQTGIGKGLQLAEIAKAHMNRTIDMPENVKNLVFVTYDAKLYADFIRDLNDVGITNVKPLITNSDFKMSTPSGENLRTANSKQHTELLTRLANEGDLGNYNIVFTTYSQLQTVKGEDTVRRDFLRRIAKDSLMILDESHNAGGTQTEFASGKPSRADFVRELVAEAGGVVFSSATYAKNPYTMTLYASRTGMRHAVEDSSSFVGMVSAGGVPLQQMLASTLTAQGQYIRRERSYEGIEFGAKVAEVDKDVAENMSTVMSRIMEFDRLKRSAVKSLHKQAKEAAERVGEDGSTGAAGAKSTNFTSLMHNVINQGLLSLKADEAAERCIAALENGEKPVLTLANTMGSFIGRAAEEQDLEVGDAITLDFGDILTRYLERSRDVVIKDAWGNKTRRQLSYDELGDEAVEHYEETLGLINSIDWSEMPISPIDYIRQKVEDAGYTTGEVTGREDRIRYEDGEQFYDVRSSVERSTAGAVASVADFNAGNIDLMILNRSGSTGISLHASERFNDQRPRRMIIAQPELDINQFMQMLGRVHRTGQVELPRFELLMGDIPAEKRPGAVLLKKMASLNANTTAARESGFSMGNITDFMNDYGDRVAVELMNNNPDLHAKLGYPISELNTSEEVNLDTIDTEGAVNKVTGRIPLLPLEEQDAVYALLEAEYNELVENERALGNSILEAETLDLDAKPLMRMEVMPKLDVGGVFGEAVNLEIMDAKSPRKPLTQLEVTNLLRRNVGLTEVEDVNEHDPETFLNDNLAQSRAQVQEIRNKALEYSRRYAAKIARDVKLEYSAPEDEEKAKDLIAKKVEKLQDKINRQFALVSRTLQDYPIGETVRVVGRDGTIYYGVVQEVVNKGAGRGNPLTPADWKLKLQLADGARQMTIPLSKLNAEKQGIQVEQSDADHNGNDIYELFDIKQTQSREKRQIFTGNVIRAYEKYSGKLINFTDSNGQVRQGLLMRKGFDIEADLAKQPVKMPTPGNCAQFFEVTNYSGMLKTKDTIMSVMGSGDGSITLTCPKAKDMGGRYYLDNNLLNRMPGREFVSVGQEMRVWIPPEDAQNVLDYFYQSGKGGLLAYSQQEKARDFLGIKMPKLEEVTLEELQAMADELPPIIDEPTTVNELQQTIAGLEQSLNATYISNLEAALAAEIDESEIPEAEQISQALVEPDGPIQEDIEQPLDSLDLSIPQEPTQAAPVVLSMYSTVDAEEASAVFVVQPNSDIDALINRLSDTLAAVNSELKFVMGVADNLAATIGDLEELPILLEDAFVQRVVALSSSGVETNQSTLEVDQYLLLSPYPAEMVEQADQINKVGPFASLEEINQFFMQFSDLASQSSVSYFNVGVRETWAMVREAGNEALEPQTFLQSFARDVVVELTGIDPEREEKRQAAIEAEVEERLNEIWTPGFAEQLQSINNASTAAVAEARKLAVDLLVSRMLAGESFEDAYAGVTDQLNEAILTFVQPEAVEAETLEVPLEIETLKAESLARAFLQMSGFGQNGMTVVEDISNRERLEMSLTHPDYSNAQPLVISKIEDIVYFEQRLNESVGAGNKSLQYRLVNEGTEMVLIDTIVGGNGRFSPEAARIQFESWIAMGYPALVQQQYPELVQQPEVAQPEVEAVAQAEPVQEVAQPDESVAAVIEPLISEPLLDGQEPVANVPQMVAESANQSGRAERNIAKFLHETGMAEVILNGMDAPNLDEGFHLRIENPPMMPLVVERHDNLLYVTHYRVPQHELDDWVMDAEMVFNISEVGILKLTETSVQNPIRGGELRTTGIRANRGFAETFSRNIMDQGFIEAAKTALAAKLEGQQVEAEEPTIAEVESEVETTVKVEAEPAIAEVETTVEVEAESEIAEVETKIETPIAVAAQEPTPFTVEPETVVAEVPQPEVVEPVATTTLEATVKTLDPREDIIARFRDRIAKGTHTRITSKDLEQLVAHFVDDISRLSHKDEIRERCATEITLLEEGYPQRSISSKYMPIYRKAVSTAIENGGIELNDGNSHTVNWQSRDGSQSGKTQEHFALTYFKYNQRTYESLRDGVADTRSQQSSEVEKSQAEVVIPASPVVEAVVETVVPEIAAEAIEQEPSMITEDVSEVAPIESEGEVAPVESVIPIEKGRVRKARTSTEEAVETEAPTYSESKVDALDAMGFNPLEITQQMLAAHDPQTLVALQEFSQSKEAQENRYSPSLKEMADWLSSAKALGRDGAYLNRISQLTNKVLEGTDEVFVSPEDRNPYARNQDFTLSNAAYQAMRRDLDQSRAASVAAMAKGILAVGGKDNGQQVLFERPNGNYRIAYDKPSKTLTIESRNAERGVILSQVDGTIAHQSITDIDQQIFKAFTDRVQQLTSAPKVAAGQER